MRTDPAAVAGTTREFVPSMTSDAPLSMSGQVVGKSSPQGSSETTDLKEGSDVIESSDAEMRAWAFYDFANSPYWQSYAVSLAPTLMTFLAELYTTKSLNGTATLFNFIDQDLKHTLTS